MIDQIAASFNAREQALSLHHARHEVLAANIANADTPNYKARDIDFSHELKKALDAGDTPGGDATGRAGLALARTSERHIAGEGAALATGGSQPALLYRVPDQPSLDGNTVDMDVERAEFADNAVRYRAALTMLNSRIRGLKNAMQPE